MFHIIGFTLYVVFVYHPLFGGVDMNILEYIGMAVGTYFVLITVKFFYAPSGRNDHYHHRSDYSGDDDNY